MEGPVTFRFWTTKWYWWSGCIDKMWLGLRWHLYHKSWSVSFLFFLNVLWPHPFTRNWWIFCLPYNSKQKYFFCQSTLNCDSLFNIYNERNQEKYSNVKNPFFFLLVGWLVLWCLISVISWRSVLLVEDTGGHGENHRPAASHWQTL